MIQDVNSESAFILLGECAQLLKNLDENSDSFFADIGRVREILSMINESSGLNNYSSGELISETLTEDKAYLQSVIDGNVDFYDSSIFEKLNEMFEKYESNIEMFSLIEKAIDRYSQFAMSL